jgi:hypothetical protein
MPKGLSLSAELQPDCSPRNHHPDNAPFLRNMCDVELRSVKIGGTLTRVSVGRAKLRLARNVIPLIYSFESTTISEGIALVELNAFAAGTICHPLMEIPAKMTDPDRWNSERETVLTITNVSVFIGFFRHTPSAAKIHSINAPRRPAGCIRGGCAF